MQQNLTNPKHKIKDLIETGQTENAVELLFNLAISSANNKDFLNAEAYRDRRTLEVEIATESNEPETQD